MKAVSGSRFSVLKIPTQAASLNEYLANHTDLLYPERKIVQGSRFKLHFKEIKMRPNFYSSDAFDSYFPDLFKTAHHKKPIEFSICFPIYRSTILSIRKLFENSSADAFKNPACLVADLTHVSERYPAPDDLVAVIEALITETTCPLEIRLSCPQEKSRPEFLRALIRTLNVPMMPRKTNAPVTLQFQFYSDNYLDEYNSLETTLRQLSSLRSGCSIILDFSGIKENITESAAEELHFLLASLQSSPAPLRWIPHVGGFFHERDDRREWQILMRGVSAREAPLLVDLTKEVVTPHVANAMLSLVSTLSLERQMTFKAAPNPIPNDPTFSNGKMLWRDFERMIDAANNAPSGAVELIAHFNASVVSPLIQNCELLCALLNRSRNPIAVHFHAMQLGLAEARALFSGLKTGQHTFTLNLFRQPINLADLPILSTAITYGLTFVSFRETRNVNRNLFDALKDVLASTTKPFEIDLSFLNDCKNLDRKTVESLCRLIVATSFPLRLTLSFDNFDLASTQLLAHAIQSKREGGITLSFSEPPTFDVFAEVEKLFLRAVANPRGVCLVEGLSDRVEKKCLERRAISLFGAGLFVSPRADADMLVSSRLLVVNQERSLALPPALRGMA